MTLRDSDCAVGVGMRFKSPPSDVVSWSLWTHPVSCTSWRWSTWSIIWLISWLIYSSKWLKQMEFSFLCFFGNDCFLELFRFCCDIGFFVIFKIFLDLFDFLLLFLFSSLLLFSLLLGFFFCLFFLFFLLLFLRYWRYHNRLRWFLWRWLRLFRRFRFAFFWWWNGLLVSTFRWRHFLCVILPAFFNWTVWQFTCFRILYDAHSLSRGSGSCSSSMWCSSMCSWVVSRVWCFVKVS